MTEKTTQGGAGAPNSELDALDRIALEAKTDEAAAAQAQADAENPQPEGPDPAEVWALIPKQLGALLSLALPELDAVYTDAACRQWGVGMAAVAQKYEWDAAETLAKWAPELALVTATIPLAVPTYFAVKKRLDDASAKREQRERMRSTQEQPGMKDINPSPMAQQPGNFSEPV